LQLPCIVARPGTVAACKSDALFELEVVCHDFDWATSSRALVRVGGRVTTPAIRSLGETDATMYHYPMFEVPPPADDVDETPPPRTADEDEDDASGDESDDDDDDATPRPPEQPRPPRRASRGVVSAVLTLAQAVSYVKRTLLLLLLLRPPLLLLPVVAALPVTTTNTRPAAAAAAAARGGTALCAVRAVGRPPTARAHCARTARMCPESTEVRPLQSMWPRTSFYIRYIPLE